MRRSVILLAASSLAGPLRAQTGEVTLIGSVTDSAGVPLPAVVVSVEGTEAVTQSDSAGSFLLSGQLRGDHVLALHGTGYTPRRFRFQIPTEHAGVLRLGSVRLQTSSAPTVSLTGTVTDAMTGIGLPASPVSLNGRVIVITDGDGRFAVATEAVSLGDTNRLSVRRVGYEPIAHDFFLSTGRSSLAFAIVLDPSPFELEAIEVEGRVSPRLAGFFRRRAMGLGHYFTKLDIERIGAQKVTDVIRRVPGANIITDDNRTVAPGAGGAGNTFDAVVIQFGRQGMFRSTISCQSGPLVFINDVQVAIPNINAFMPPERIAGMEVYASDVQIPVEYAKVGSECGVIVLWTDEPFGGATIAGRSTQVGFYVGVRVHDGKMKGQRAGTELGLPLLSWLAFHPGFNIVLGSSGETFDQRWQVLANFKVRPFGTSTPWYVGTGVSFVKETQSRALQDPNDVGRPPVEVRLANTLLTGLSWPLGSIRPYAELQILNRFGSDWSSYVFGGFAIVLR